MNHSLHPKTALITGASAGIGEALAREAARRGYDLVLVARRQARLDELSAELTKAHGVSCHSIVQDLSVPGAADTIAAQVAELGLQIDLLVNNAGVGVYGHFWETDWTKEQEVLQVNIMALVSLTRLILPGMLDKKRGQIMNIGSIAGFQPGPMMPLYYASKAFVLSFSEGLSMQLKGTGVSLTLVCPGMVTTEFAARSGGSEEVGNRLGLKPMRADEVASQSFVALGRNQRLFIPGLNNRMGTLAVRFLPRRVVLEIVERGQRIMRS